jgi:TetR/AcrR family transcriptional regulator, transcriptional repressor for nem operon
MIILSRIIPKKLLTVYQLVGMFSYQLIGMPMPSTETKLASKTRFLDAALHVIRAKGYSATRIEDICEAAGLTKGSFFHHFDSKEALALDAAEYWIEGSEALFVRLC